MNNQMICKLTIEEIEAARTLVAGQPDTQMVERMMPKARWERKGWRGTDVLYGILIGLEIATHRLSENDPREVEIARLESLLDTYQALAPDQALHWRDRLDHRGK